MRECGELVVKGRMWRRGDRVQMPWCRGERRDEQAGENGWKSSPVVRVGGGAAVKGACR